MHILNVSLLLASTCLLTSTSFADTFQIKSIGAGGAQGFVGLSDAGTVVYVRDIACPGSGSSLPPCYVSLYTDGSETFSSTPPAFPFMAAAANTSLSNGSYSVAVDRPVNGGLTVTTPNGQQVVPPVTPFGFDTLWNLDPMGDFTVCDCVDNDYFEVIDMTSRQAPEPESLLLLGTGLLSAIGIARRRV